MKRHLKNVLSGVFTIIFLVFAHTQAALAYPSNSVYSADNNIIVTELNHNATDSKVYELTGHSFKSENNGVVDKYEGAVIRTASTYCFYIPPYYYCF